MNAVLWWTIENTLTVAALLPAVWLACWMLRARPAAQHLLWLLLLVKLVAPPLVDWPWDASSLWHPAVQTSLAPAAPPIPRGAPQLDANWDAGTDIETVEFGDMEPVTAVVEAPLAPPAATASRPGWNPVTLLIVAWSIGAAAMLALAGRGLLLQRSVLRTSRSPSAQLIVALARSAARLRVRPPRAAVSNRVESPVVACLPRPKLIWPEVLDEPAAISASDGILAHELAHVARRDHFVVGLETLILACQWWNPLAWYLRRKLRESRELACDALALAHGRQSRSDYAQRLLALSVVPDASLPLAPAFGAGTFSRRFLQRRLTMIFDSRTHGRVTPGGALAAALLAAVALPGFASAFQADAAPAASNDTAPVTAAGDAAPPAPDGDSSDTAPVSGDRVSIPVLSEIPIVGRLYDATNVPSADSVTTVAAMDLNQPRNPAVVDVNANVVQSIALAQGGTVDISQGDDGQLRLTIRQADGKTQGFILRLANAHVLQNGANWKADSVNTQQAVSTWRDAVNAPATDAAAQWQVSKAVTVPDNVPAARYVTVQDVELLQSDVELAEINLAEKQAQLAIAEEEHVSGAKLQLAKLAVRRAEIELKRSRAKLRQDVPAANHSLQPK